MRRLKLAVVGGLLVLATGLCAAEPAVESTPQMTVNLKDGSRIIGEPSSKNLPVRSETMGKLDIPLDKVRSLKFSADHEAVAVTLQNGDQIQGALGLASVSLKTVFGLVSIPLETATDITMRSSGSREQNGLVLYYGFDADERERVTDQSGEGNDGLVRGVGHNAQGHRGGAFDFDGGKCHIRVAASASLNITDGVTITAWVKPAQVTEQSPIVEWNDNAGNAGVHLWLAVPPGGPGSLFANFISTAGETHIIRSAPQIVVAGRYQHVAASYDKSTGAARLYVNGQVVAEDNLGQFTPQTSYDLYLAYRPSGAASGTAYKGMLDELMIFDRALTAEEIAADYDTTK